MWSKKIGRTDPAAGSSAEQQLLDAVTAALYDEASPAGSIGFDGAAPRGGWIEATFQVDRIPFAKWDLSNVLDPFSAQEVSSNSEFETAIVPWLEHVAAGQDSSLLLDMEGPIGIITVKREVGERVRVVAAELPGGLLLNVTIDRRKLVTSMYDAVLGYWESDKLNANWLEWAPNKTKWPLQSGPIRQMMGEDGPDSTN